MLSILAPAPRFSRVRAKIPQRSTMSGVTVCKICRNVVKEGVIEHEAEMQRRAARLLPENVPRVVRYEKALERMKMELVRGETLAEWFGEHPSLIPEDIWTEVRRLVMVLYEAGIVYSDVTGYNFMIERESGKIWMIDFEHCTARAPGPFTDGDELAEGESWFVREFLSGDSGNVWNEDFA